MAIRLYPLGDPVAPGALNGTADQFASQLFSDATPSVLAGVLGLRAKLFPGRPLTIIPFGTSLTAATNTDAGFGGYSQLGPGFATASIMQSGYPWRIIRNAGVAGNTTAQMLARLNSDVLAYSPDVALVEPGGNDYAAGMSALPTMFNNFEQIIVRLIKAGVFPIIVVPTPRGDGTQAVLDTSRVGRWFCYELAKFYGLPLLDMFRAVVDPATGTYKAGLSSDGNLHPNAAAIQVLAADFGPKLASPSTLVCPTYFGASSETTTGNLANLFQDGNFALPSPNTTWQLDTTNGTPSYATAASPFTGNTLTYAKSNSTASNAIQQGASNIAVAGDTLEFSFAYSISGLNVASNQGGLTVGLNMGAALLYPGYNWAINGSNTNVVQRFVVPTGVTGAAFQFYARDAATYTLNAVTLVNVSRLWAIWKPGQQNL